MLQKLPQRGVKLGMILQTCLMSLSILRTSGGPFNFAHPPSRSPVSSLLRPRGPARHLRLEPVEAVAEVAVLLLQRVMVRPPGTPARR